LPDDDTQIPAEDEQAPAADAGADAATDSDAPAEGAAPEIDTSGVDTSGVDAENSVEPNPDPEPSANDAGDSDEATAPAGEVDPALLATLGDEQGALVPFATSARDIIQVGLETVAGQPATVSGVRAALSDYEALTGEFEAVDHLGFELKIAISDTEALLAAALVPIEHVGALFGIDTSADAMADETFAEAQLETVGQRVRELLDLVSLTLFDGGLAGAEATLTEVRRGQIEWTLGMVQDVAQGALPLRLDFTPTLQGGASAAITLVLPVSLLSRFAGLLGTEETAGTSAPAVAETAAPPPDSGTLSNVSAFPGGDSSVDEQPASLFGVGSDAEAHPLRFPALPEQSSDASAPQPIDLIMDVSMRVTVELGRSTMTVEEILELGPGSVVELNKLAGEPVDILVNDRLIARGEVVVVDENFGVRVTEIISPRKRASAMGR
jgi:flagellar motor switch protein FliN